MTQISRVQPAPRLLPVPPASAAATRTAPPVRPATQGLTVASLSAGDTLAQPLATLERLARRLGVSIDVKAIPSGLARAGQVGRIGVPREAAAVMQQQGVLIGSTFGGDPLAPVARLFRGLQRRADVVVDVRPFVTLPGTRLGADSWERDVLLFSQRPLERTTARRDATNLDDAREQARSRDAAALAYRLCAAERRKLMLVLPVGRGTRAQQAFAEALQQHAIANRLAPPRIVKAGLLAALLSGESGRERWLVSSVIPIDELSAMVSESVGPVVNWPVLSYGRGASFYDLPVTADGDAVPLLLVLASLLQRSGRSELAQSLQASVLMTCAARTRAAEELGVSELRVPLDDFVAGVLANWGREPVMASPRERRSVDRDPLGVAGLRLRIESALPATAVRDAITSALRPTGLEVASVRSIETRQAQGDLAFDVRVRGRLGESPMGDDTSPFALRALGPALKCVAVEPWVPGAGLDLPRMRDANLMRATRARSAEQA